MQKCLFSLVFLLMLPLLPLPALAQAQQNDTSFVSEAVAEAVQLYRKSINIQSHLYTGAEYHVPQRPYLDGDQYYGSSKYAPAAVKYDGAWYHDVPLLYDVVQGEIVTVHPASGYALKLVKEKVEAFVLPGDEVFVSLHPDTAAGAVLQPGFYGVLYDGQVKVYVLRDKEVQERVTPDGLEGEFKVVDKYFLYKDDAYHEVSRKRHVLSLLQDEKKPLKKFIRENKLRFRKQREKAIVSVAQQYDKLKN
ncbi:hypothetical protein [Pontibacter mangrovi]|uniref:Uncharacterized protein n=1 Tax=Pontibacter mangrovi TaxID=2589816 RepID=A0A501VXB1_9BACT|nr:hypothetical protein [Pontibacter mangrovi]TPE39581.1 hypothetical protein FJM65_20930 [Pontibacter mangrovi]